MDITPKLFFNFLNAMNSLLIKSTLFQKISKYKLKFKTNPWIIFGTKKSISMKKQTIKEIISK